MGNFNVRIIKADDGTEIHLLTRGRSKPITDEEYREYAEELKAGAHKKEDTEEWNPHNVKMFLTDLRSGVAFCSQKYGVTEEVIEEYIRTRAPHINLSAWRPDGPGSSGRG